LDWIAQREEKLRQSLENNKRKLTEICREQGTTLEKFKALQEKTVQQGIKLKMEKTVQ
jgi:hypothetical protein